MNNKFKLILILITTILTSSAQFVSFRNNSVSSGTPTFTWLGGSQILK